MIPSSTQESKSQEKTDEQTKQQVAGAQAPNTSSTSAQHANTEKTAQGTMTHPKEPTAIIETTAGNITCTLFPGQAPLTVANFIGLSNGTKDWKDPKTGQTVHGVPLYNGTIFHRVIPNFMIQGGDPVGNGSGDPGYSFKDEFSPSLTFDQPGRLAMANSGPNTNGSQFFITEVPTPHLNGHHTIFGQCQDLDVVKKIARLIGPTYPVIVLVSFRSLMVLPAFVLALRRFAATQSFMFLATKFQFASFQKASTYLGRALRQSM
jgi:cyclophilin family peptidyl-prolyl cis-trans isomerase